MFLFLNKYYCKKKNCPVVSRQLQSTILRVMSRLNDISYLPTRTING